MMMHLHDRSHTRSFMWRYPLGKKCMCAWHDGTFTQTLNEARQYQPSDAIFCGNWHEEGKHRVDEHAPAEELKRAIFLRGNAEWNLLEVDSDTWLINNIYDDNLTLLFGAFEKMWNSLQTHPEFIVVAHSSHLNETQQLFDKIHLFSGSQCLTNADLCVRERRIWMEMWIWDDDWGHHVWRTDICIFILASFFCEIYIFSLILFSWKIANSVTRRCL